LLPAPPSEEADLVLELDELCSFVANKANKRRWIWIALAR